MGESMSCFLDFTAKRAHRILCVLGSFLSPCEALDRLIHWIPGAEVICRGQDRALLLWGSLEGSRHPCPSWGWWLFLHLESMPPPCRSEGRGEGIAAFESSVEAKRCRWGRQAAAANRSHHFKNGAMEHGCEGLWGNIRRPFPIP